MRRQQALVERAVRIDRVSQRVTLRSLPCGRLQTHAFAVVVAELRQRPVQRAVVPWINKPRGAVPQFAKRRYVGEHQGASGSGGFKNRKPEWFVKGRAD